MRNTRVPGHGLKSEGAAYVGEGICEVGVVSAPKPYDNPCPTCGAKPGSPCRILGSNRKAELHAARLVGGVR